MFGSTNLVASSLLGAVMLLGVGKSEPANEDFRAASGISGTTAISNVGPIAKIVMQPASMMQALPSSPLASDLMVLRLGKSPWPASAQRFDTFIIYSDLQIPPYGSCGYAPAVFGTEPYTYLWKMNGKIWTTNESIFFEAPGSGTVYLQLWVTDANNEEGYADLTLYVDPEGPDSCYIV